MALPATPSWAVGGLGFAGTHGMARDLDVMTAVCLTALLAITGLWRLIG
jgi:hypothetical protein